MNRYFFPDHSATSQLLSDLCFELARQGASVCVIASRQIIDDPHACLSAHEIVRGVRVYRVWSPSFGRQKLLGRGLDYLGFYVNAMRCANNLLTAGDILVAKTDPPMLSVVMSKVARNRGALLVNWLQDLFPEVAQALGIKGFSGLLPVLLKRLRNQSLRRAHMNVVLGRLMHHRLRHEGIDEKRIRIIHNWADGEALSPLPGAENPLRQQWGLSDKFVIEYSGNMGRAHEFDAIVDAARILKDAPRIRFLFIGGGVLRGAIERGVQQYNLRNVVFKPYQERQKLRQSLSVGDVHLISLNQKLEGLIVPSKFYGIAAVGRASIYLGDGRGEIGQIIHSSGCGICLPQQDSESLARVILDLEADPEACLEQGRQARRVFESRFAKSIAMQAWSEVLSG